MEREAPVDDLGDTDEVDEEVTDEVALDEDEEEVDFIDKPEDLSGDDAEYSRH